MRFKNVFMLAAAAALVPAALSFGAAALKTGQQAPAFNLPDPQGKIHQLKDFQGKYVVLEWFNNKCPFIRKHYDSGNMQSLQKRYTERGVIWLSILSSAPGKEGYADSKEAAKEFAENHSHATAILLDPAGTAGLAYGAKTTPHMFVIGPDGKILYQGAIDDHPSTDVEDIPASHNYVAAALDAALAGQPILVTETKAYGCSVKYAK